MRNLIAVMGVICLLGAASGAFAAPSGTPELKQSVVFTHLTADIEQLAGHITLDQAGHEEIETAQTALTSIQSVNDRFHVRLSQQSLQSLNNLDEAVQTIASQAAIQKAELVQLRAISDDLRVKNDHCLTMWSREGGLQEVPVIVHTQDPAHPGQEVSDCQVACVIACFYGTPAETAHTHWFSASDSPVRDLLTPGLYYFWTKRGTATLPAVKRRIIYTRPDQTSVTISVPTPKAEVK